MGFFRVLLLAIALFGVVNAQAAEVVDLSPSSFDAHVGKDKHVLVKFFAPWCGHCKRMVPEYRKLAEMVSSHPGLKGRVTIAEVDADSHRDLGERFDITGFPTVKFFPRRSLEAEDYQLARTAESMLEFLENKLASDRTFARVAALDAVARRVGAGEIDPLEAAKEIETAIERFVAEEEAENAENAKLYLKYTQRAANKGVQSLPTEAARLERLAAAKASPAKLADIDRKLSVLSAFTQDDDEDEDEDVAEA